MVEIYILLLLLLQCSCVLCVPVKHDECTYEFDVETKVFRIACAKNVTLTVKGNGKTMIMSGDQEEKPLWFQRLSGVSMTKNNGNKTIRESLGPNVKTVRKLKDATKLLRRAKKRLTFRTGKIDNITETLESGDRDLQNDLEALHKFNPGTVHAHRAMIAALQNQYRYLQMAMLTQNNEMKELISAIKTLVSATQKSVRSSLALNNDYQQEMVMLYTTLLKSNISRAEKRKDFCPRKLVSIGNGDRVYKVGIPDGTVMKDPIHAGQIWVSYGHSDINQIIAFKNFDDFGLNIASIKQIMLPFFCEGTGGVVFENMLYCHKMMTNKIVKYNIMEGRWIGELELVGAGAHNAFPYQSGLFSDVDFAVDEYGLWVIYATEISHGNIMIAKIAEQDFTVSETWMTQIPKREVGNSFMICGVLYAIDSYDKTPSFIKYIYNTNTGGGKILSPSDIPFVNAIQSTYVHTYMLDYNPMERKLFAWNHGRVEIYSVETEEE
ncbi:hypothetical protein FSP39_009410 [Pinctada imbricata]|uniref:Olfactomedin-like domain-containing protein n=1 Tax=Pinctada imbricata TaxID=66713 RepID=A0AA89BVN1_PINIB|nr:hypothetical protein FSP39_009410 [Pinctada imbricata]